MKTRNILILTILVVLVAFNVFVNFIAGNLKKQVNDLNAEIGQLSNVNKVLNLNYLYCVESRSIRVPNVSLVDKNNVSVRLAEVLKGDKTLVLRLPEFACTTCYEAFFKNAAKMDSICMSRLVIIATYENIHLLNNFQRVNQIFCDSYNLSSKKLIVDSEIEELNRPVIIEINQNLEIKSIHILDKSNLQLTFDYLSRLRMDLVKK